MMSDEKDMDRSLDLEAESISPLDRLIAIMAQLRDPDGGCPWDLQQNFATIAPYTIEEAYEVADAIDRGDMPELRDELGDLLLQVVFHARMAEEQGAFAFNDVARAIGDKMIARHPHIFSPDPATCRDNHDAAQQTASWEAIKAEERRQKAASGTLDGVARALPALMRAQKLGKRAGRVGFDWPDVAGVVDKVREELAEVVAEIPQASPSRLTDEIGDLLFTVVQLGRRLGVDAEEALRQCNQRFEARFSLMETEVHAQGETIAQLGGDDLENAWQVAKQRYAAASATPEVPPTATPMKQSSS